MSNDFYRSKVWEKVRKTYAMSKYCICERCDRPVYVDGVSQWIPKEKRLRGIVHHKERLNKNNYDDYNVSLNYDNLELLCIDCHNEEHFSKGATRKGLCFDEMGNLIRKDNYISEQKTLLKSH